MHEPAVRAIAATPAMDLDPRRICSGLRLATASRRRGAEGQLDYWTVKPISSTGVAPGPGTAIETGAPALKKAMEPSPSPGAVSASKRKLYIEPQRIALALGFW